MRTVRIRVGSISAVSRVRSLILPEEGGWVRAHFPEQWLVIKPTYRGLLAFISRGMIKQARQSQIIFYGEAPAGGLTLLYIPFSTKKYFFRLPSIDKWYRFYIPFNSWRCTLSKIWTNHKTRTSSHIIFLRFLDLFTDQSNRFSYDLWYTSTQE